MPFWSPARLPSTCSMIINAMIGLPAQFVAMYQQNPDQ
jgi:hypothetical protein